MERTSCIVLCMFMACVVAGVALCADCQRHVEIERYRQHYSQELIPSTTSVRWVAPRDSAKVR